MINNIMIEFCSDVEKYFILFCRIAFLSAIVMLAYIAIIGSIYLIIIYLQSTS